MENTNLVNFHRFYVYVTDNDIQSRMCRQQVLTYTAGFFAVSKKMKREFCRVISCNENIERLPDNDSYIHGISRDALLYHDDAAFNIIMYNYLVINKLTQHLEVTKSLHPRNVASDITVCYTL